ncbi:MAG: RAD55 family ATPase [Candidatus Bathyarchaeota archaeon]|nr:RAD55 family ATPase [Candidatus Bathyarchaeota archaeon]
MKLIKTGIAGLDELLTGGIPPKIILLVGLPGSGNEVFAQQVASSRAKETPVTYFTINTTPDTIREDMAAYNWDITALEKSGNWKFKTLTGHKSLTQTILEEMKQNRTVIIDSISELLLVNKLEELIELLTQMSKQNTKCEQYHLLLMTTKMQDQLVETAIQHFAEGIIVFNTNWTKDPMQRDIIIKKMRGIFISERRIPYKISKRGFVIETATRIT